MQKDAVRLLNRLGLKDRESRIYLACLRTADGLFTHEIVKTTRITRSTTDVMVRRLLARGFLNRVKVGRRYRFFAQPPEAILFRQKQLTEDFEKAIPLLSQIGGQRKENEILYFEGAKGAREIYNDILLVTQFAVGEKRDILAIVSGKDFVSLFPDMQKAFIAKRIRNKSWYKAIATATSEHIPEYTNDPKALRHVKYVTDEDFLFRIEMLVYGDNVMMYSPTPPVGGVIIRNEKISDSMRSLFYLLWKILPESKK